MKKTFTLLATVALMTSAAFAQNNGNHRGDNYGNDNHRDIAINNNRDRGDDYNDRGTYYFTEREKDMQIAQINREYYNKIQSVRNKFFMGRYQKERMITSLQFQRDEEVHSVMAKFNRRENHYDQRDSRYRDHDNRNWK